jgi:SAM-dependent methyltransferase
VRWSKHKRGKPSWRQSITAFVSARPHTVSVRTTSARRKDACRSRSRPYTPHLKGIDFDLACVEEAFARYVRKHGLAGRLQFYPGDFFVDPLPRADVLLMGRILHNWNRSIRTMLLEKAYRAISPGGALIVYDPLIDDERRSPHGLLSSLNMLLETSGGSEYSAAECESWMLAAGFRDIRVEPLGDMHVAVIGSKTDTSKD